jgi:hypothetical protein
MKRLEVGEAIRQDVSIMEKIPTNAQTVLREGRIKNTLAKHFYFYGRAYRG